MVSDAEALFKRFDTSGLGYAEITDEARGWWIAQADDLAAPAITLAAVAKPGDTVLIAFDHLMGDDEFNTMRDRLRPLKEQLGIQIALIEGASSMIVVRPELDVNSAPMRRSVNPADNSPDSRER